MRLVLAAIGLSCVLRLGIAAEQSSAADAPVPPDLTAESYYLMDASSGAVLADFRGDEQLPPASLTKLMSAYGVFRALASGQIHLTDEVHVSERAWRMPGSRMFIEVNSDVLVQDLVQGMIVQSGNDASVALAEHIAGSVEAFVELMNRYAAELGMNDTVYRNPTGLPAEGHYSSAHDQAILASALIAEFPDYYAWYRQREFTYNGIKQHNRNSLLWRDASVDGLKTGHTVAAGYCLVSSAERDGMRLISVVMGMPTPKERAEGSQQLLEYGFNAYETHRIYTTGQPVTEARVWKGEPHSVTVGPVEDLYVTIPRGRYGDLSAIMELQPQLIAPLDASVPVGEIRVSFAGESLTTLPVVALHSVAEGGLWTRLADGVKSWRE
jgi:serine-type D-Ala-D-Ala carboxypeptidase (penicillin-binding protein 5/6)